MKAGPFIRNDMIGIGYVFCYALFQFDKSTTMANNYVKCNGNVSNRIRLKCFNRFHSIWNMRNWRHLGQKSENYAVDIDLQCEKRRNSSRTCAEIVTSKMTHKNCNGWIIRPCSVHINIFSITKIMNFGPAEGNSCVQIVFVILKIVPKQLRNEMETTTGMIQYKFFKAH